MSAMLLAQQILNGLLDGVYYLLIALGLSLIFSLGGIVNLAHGAFYAIGAYLTLVISPYLGFGGAFVAAPVAVALFGVVIERTLFRRFYRSDPILSLLLTFGLAMVAEQVLRMIFGAPPLSYSIPPWLRGQVAIGSFIYSFYRVVLLGIAATCIAGLWLLLQKTSFGRVVRAGVQNPDMVGALGISLQPYMSAVAALGIGADLFDPSGDGPGDHHAGLRRGGDRRSRIVLGRRCRGAVGRPRQGRDGRHRLFRGVDRGDLSLDAVGAAVPAARPVRRTYHAVRVRR
jgi:ABC-type branched-subunit amino acid transport system permease subunit